MLNHKLLNKNSQYGKIDNNIDKLVLKFVLKDTNLA